MAFELRTSELGVELLGPDGARCVVVPAVGSQLASLRLSPEPAAPAVEVLQAPSLEHLERAGWGAGAPILFPFPGRVQGGTYPYRGKTYHIHGARHPLHGFVGLVPWTVVDGEATDLGVWVRTRVDHADLGVDPESFPGRYVLEVTHRLDAAGYGHDIEVCNAGDGPFPFGYGWHPYFRTPLVSGGLREDCAVRVPAQARWELTAELLPTGRRLAVEGAYDLREGRPLAGRSLDDPFTLLQPDEDGWSEAALTDPAAALRLTVRADAAFAHWVVYGPRTLGAVCLEPYTCVPDAFNLEARGVPSGLMELEPGDRWQGRLRVRLERAAV